MFSQSRFLHADTITSEHMKRVTQVTFTLKRVSFSLAVVRVCESGVIIVHVSHYQIVGLCNSIDLQHECGNGT